MCGIAGFVNRPGQPADRAIVTRMIDALAHRGPDGDGVYLDGPTALGHRRLSIIDVDGGAQPMPNEDETVWVSYNGELYNEPALREWLLGRGHQFRNRSDTEALVHLYEEDGPGFVCRLNGMFALALWDARNRRLVLARDRMGQKPLFWCQTPAGGLAFGSEPKALLAHPDVPRRLDPDGLARYLTYEYLPAPHCIWEGVRKLPRGHYLVWEDGRATVSRYWPGEIGSPPPAPSTKDDGDPERFWSDFVAATARHRRSDVPLGVFLSGGIDSSSVAAAVCQVEPARSVRTFSIGFNDPSFDESSFAREVAGQLGTDHHERTFSVADVHRLLPEVSAWLDEPFGDASILPTHLLCRFARDYVTVALGGDGADELLAGYPTFAAGRAARLWRRAPRPLRQFAAAAASRLPVDHRNFSLDFKAKQFLRGADLTDPLAHLRWLGSFSGPELVPLLTQPPRVDVEAELLRRAESLKTSDSLESALELYQDTYLPEDILTKVDRASMACSLEVRAPFLDADLVDRIRALPSSLKLRRGHGKWLLKRAAASHLPPSVLGRGKKGFGIPIARWLNGELAPLLDRLLAPDRLDREGLFRPTEVARLVGEHRAGVANHRKPLWTLMVFQLWKESWLGG